MTNETEAILNLYKETDKSLKIIEPVLIQKAKEKRGKVFKGERNYHPRRALEWNEKTDGKIIEKAIEVFLNSDREGLKISGFVTYDDCDKGIRYWKDVVFEERISKDMISLVNENIDEYIRRIDMIKIEELKVGTKIDNPYPKLKLKYSMMIGRFFQAIIDFVSKSRIK